MLPKNIFKSHQHIGLDLDDTLVYSAMDGIKKLHATNRMQSIQDIDHITSFDWTEFPGCDMTQEEIMDFWKMHSLEGADPVENSITGVFELSQKNKSLHIVTARNEHDHRRDSEQWLNIYFPEIHPSNIHFANHFSKYNHAKSTICQSLGITLMIDDGLHNALDLVEHGIVCILLDKPWNRKDTSNHPLIHRVQDWQEIIDNLSSK